MQRPFLFLIGWPHEAEALSFPPGGRGHVVSRVTRNRAVEASPAAVDWTVFLSYFIHL